MNLSDNCELAYIVGREAWYHDTDPGREPYVRVGADHSEGGCEWEFMVTEHPFNGGCIRVEMFSDAFAAMVQVPEFFRGLVERKPTSLEALRLLLDDIGARDTTERVNPYAAR